MVPVAGLDALAAAVTEATAGLVAEPDERPFRGHITLARSHDQAAARRCCGTPAEATFPVDEIAVVTSETHPDGARYSRHATIALRERRRGTEALSDLDQEQQ